jgi:hypothetical protein
MRATIQETMKLGFFLLACILVLALEKDRFVEELNGR